MNRNGQGRGIGRGQRGNGNSMGRGNHRHGESSRGHGRRGRGMRFGRGMGWQSGPDAGIRQNRPISEFIAELDESEKKSWLENFKAHLTQRMSEVDEELGKL